MTEIKKDPRVHIVINKDAVSRGAQPTDLAPKRMRDNSGAYTKRAKKPGETPMPFRDIWTKDYYDGADLKPFQGRPGSLDFLKCKSLGLST